MSRPAARVTFILFLFIALATKLLMFEGMGEQRVGAWYSLAVVGYLLARFCVSYLDVPVDVDASFHPTVSVVVPCKNEEDAIGQTLRCIASSDYPRSLVDICVINDGSTDGTLKAIRKAKRPVRRKGVKMRVVDWSESRGKRDGMVAGFRATAGRIVVFIDSDSFLEPGAVRELVAPFANRRVGAVSGHTDVFNRDTNLLTRMQAVRYHLSFRVHKAAEGALGGVTCCSGCCAAYRREYLDPILEEWQHQRFLGRQCTYGDDRSLTNRLLALGHRTLYSETARAQTIVPDTVPVYLRQQLRWRKSWLRESLIASRFMWKRNPLLSSMFYLGFLLPLLSPLIVLYSLIYQPFVMHVFPATYLSGLLIVTVIYAAYYRAQVKHRGWMLGAVLVTASSVAMSWQLPWAALKLADGRWGTR